MPAKAKRPPGKGVGEGALPRNDIQQALLDWYYGVARDLPWRQTRDPYAIWVSEIMLQQTRVATVIPYYERFLDTLPTLAALADADDEVLRRLWKGLGYYRRVSLLQRGARQVMAEHGGKLPRTYSELRTLSGLGPYTAGAVASIAFGQPVSAVDGNVIRVFSRWMNDSRSLEDIRKSLQGGVADEWVAHRDPGSWNQALMELGATVCTPRRPRCGDCPVRGWCRALAANTVDDLPRKAKKTPNVALTMRATVYRKGKAVWLEQRPAQGLLAGLWGFPIEEIAATEDDTLAVLRYRHVFTHRTWHVSVHLSHEPPPTAGQWVTLDQLHHEAIPTAFRPIVDWLTTPDLFSA